MRDRAQRVGGSPGTPLNTGRIPVCVCVPSPGGVRLPGPPRTSSITITAFGAAGAARSPVTTGGGGGGGRGVPGAAARPRGAGFFGCFFFWCVWGKAPAETAEGALKKEEKKKKKVSGEFLACLETARLIAMRFRFETGSRQHLENESLQLTKKLCGFLPQVYIFAPFYSFLCSHLPSPRPSPSPLFLATPCPKTPWPTWIVSTTNRKKH